MKTFAQVIFKQITFTGASRFSTQGVIDVSMFDLQ